MFATSAEPATAELEAGALTLLTTTAQINTSVGSMHKALGREEEGCPPLRRLSCPPAASPVLVTPCSSWGTPTSAASNQRPRRGGSGSGKATRPPARAVNVSSASMAAVQTTL